MNDLTHHRRRLNLRLLQVSIALCLLCVLTGLAIFCIEGGTHVPATQAGSLAAILENALRRGEGLHAGAFLEAGLIVLLLTPVARLVAGIYLSARARDALYVVIGMIVLGLVVVGMLVGQGGG